MSDTKSDKAYTELKGIMLKVLKGQGEITENLNNLTDAVVEGFDNVENSLTRLEGKRVSVLSQETRDKLERNQ